LLGSYHHSTLPDAEKHIHAFIFSLINYGNALSGVLPAKSLQRLQLIQNSAARVLTRTKKSDHITPILAQLHWLPVNYRIDFKILMLVFKALNGLSPNNIVTSSQSNISHLTLSITCWQKCYYVVLLSH
jgi:hypothetical protein